MPGVVVGMEANQIAMQDALEQLVANRQDTIDLAAREGRVKEEADLDILASFANGLAQNGRKQHLGVIVHPNEITILHVLGNGLSEDLVGLVVSVPGSLVKGNFSRVIVEERPEDGI